jgi:hypothetical protein
LLKQLLLIALLSLSGVSVTLATDMPKDPGPEVINFRMGVMILPFQHKKHQERLNNECYHCHGKSASRKIAGWGKETAHTLCISCHDLDDKGPIECHQCHKK